MAFVRTLRLNLYGWLLALGIVNNVLTGMLAGWAQWNWRSPSGYSYETKLPYASHFVAYFACIGAALSFLTWVWISVLVAYNHRRKADHILATALAQFSSFTVLSVLWLIIGIMLLSETRYSCPNMPGPEAIITIWCALSISSGTLGLFMMMIAAIAAVTIYRFSRELPLGLHSPVVAPDRAHDAGPLKGTMRSPTRIRTAWYGTIIALGLPGSAFGIMHALGSYDEKLQALGGLAASLSTVTWVWASVLLSYNRRPSVTRTLTRASTHFYTLISLAVLNLTCGILILASTRPHPGYRYYNEPTYQCDGIAYNFCWVHFTDGALSLALTFLLIAAAVCIYRQTARHGDGLSNSNVARFDGEGPETVNRDEVLKLDP